MSSSILNNDESENASHAPQPAQPGQPAQSGAVIRMVDEREADRQTRRQAVLGLRADLPHDQPPVNGVPLEQFLCRCAG